MNKIISKVYVLLDLNYNVVRIEGQYTLPENLEDWVLVDCGEPCDRLNLAQTHYLDKPLVDEHGRYNYKYEKGKVVEKTDEEKDAEYAPIIPKPTATEKLEAQVLYTAIMTDTLIEEV